MLSDSPSAVHPPLGTLIDDDSLELVEVLGVGGYGVVYRAEDTCSSSPKSYAVKCLVHRHTQSARQRQIHIREIALHQIASAHPNVVTLHRVIEDFHCTYIIMDYAPDHDLFSQILHSCRYLGDDYLIKHVFLQLLDAVEYCHSLGIYHRDLKPENVLCFDGGLRVAITDFGLATTDKLSEEFRTGSVYHMSPECQGGEFAPTGTYSPMFNDIWSLGIILLNLATGRNPWKSASASDPTFQAYLRDPVNFMPTVLPISQEVNTILTRTLEVDWRERMTLPELRQAIEEVETFYSDGVIFEGSMARCPWEAGMEIDSDSSATKHSPIKSQTAELKSHWSQESSSSDIIFASHSTSIDSPWVDYVPRSTAAYAFNSNSSGCGPEVQEECRDIFTRPRTPPSIQSPCVSESVASFPVTPNSFDVSFGGRAVMPQRKPLVIDTACARTRYYHSDSLGTLSSASSAMQTAVEFPSDPHNSESFYITRSSSFSKTSIVVPQSVHLGDSTGTPEDKEMASPMVWDCSATQVSIPSMYSSMRSSFTTTHISFDPRSSAPSPEAFGWSTLSTRSESQPAQSQQSFSLCVSNVADVSVPPPRPISPNKKSLETKLKATLFTPLKFFPRATWQTSSSSSGTSTPSKAAATHTEVEECSSESVTAVSFCSTPVPVPQARMGQWESYVPVAQSSATSGVACFPSQEKQNCRKPSNLRTPRARHWFLPYKLFASSGTS